MKNLILSSVITLSMLTLVSCNHDNDPVPQKPFISHQQVEKPSTKQTEASVKDSVVTKATTHQEYTLVEAKDVSTTTPANLTETEGVGNPLHLEEGTGIGMHSKYLQKEKSGVGEPVYMEEGVGEGTYAEYQEKVKEGVGDGLMYEPQTQSNHDLTGSLIEENGQPVDFVLIFSDHENMDVYVDYKPFDGNPDRQTVYRSVEHWETVSRISFMLDGNRYFYEK
ncbi:hypothetical protein [Flammeovirga agarivorans]|uniref:Lipoprotein n=1 Tax=Flammeovirga agarivorans TaxID=2726742 RepID=A0A7X8SJX2_9BACT|nr:hypothetical protein [Flammeovirga agarivorans]NLR91620.1 hypothetical protein [Flammeovirga agarivorans]